MARYNSSQQPSIADRFFLAISLILAFASVRLLLTDADPQFSNLQGNAFRAGDNNNFGSFGSNNYGGRAPPFGGGSGNGGDRGFGIFGNGGNGERYQYRGGANSNPNANGGFGQDDIDRSNIWDPDRDGLWDPVLYPNGLDWGDEETPAQSGRVHVVNMKFQIPFYGGRYNYSMIMTDGYIAYAEPPPGARNIPVFPNPKYPDENDHAFIAPFYTRADYVRGDSHCYLRMMTRGENWHPGNRLQQRFYLQNDQVLKQIERDIQEGMPGANDFQAMHALIVTWVNLTFQGANWMDDITSNKAPYNTYQAAIVTDEIRTYAVFNYQEISWTTHTGARGNQFTGLGGFPALVGFNGGNATGFWELDPYSGNAILAQIDERSNVNHKGRYIFRIDEVMQPAGCTLGKLEGEAFAAPAGSSMLGGEVVNVTGPCFMPEHDIRCRFQEYEVKAQYVSMTMARCIVPAMFITGWADFGISVNGGRTYTFRGQFFVAQHERAVQHVKLRGLEQWFEENPRKLALEWSVFNLTFDPNQRAEIGVWGYREVDMQPKLDLLGIIATDVENNGYFEFDAWDLRRRTGNKYLRDGWRDYTFGVIRINTTDRPDENAHLFSDLVPLSWYYHDDWVNNWGWNYGRKWCREWYYRDRILPQFIGYLQPCPCTLKQALADKGRFAPSFSCDYRGKMDCPFHRGAKHCVVESAPSYLGSGQQCCYDQLGRLMLTHDYDDGGTPNRAHPWGWRPYRVSRKIPNLSNWQHDIMPWFFCCKWSDTCEMIREYRRASHDCVGYKHAGAALSYGDPHFITFDNTKFTYNSKGEFVLLRSIDPRFNVQVQVRFQQPPDAPFGRINGTVITAVVMRENDSSVVEVQSRQQHMRWRYRMTVLVDKVPAYFDRPWLKLQEYNGLSVHSPEDNLDQSEINVRFLSGIGVEIKEFQGMLEVSVYMPPDAQNKTMGLLGNWSGIPQDDLVTPDGAIVSPDSSVRTIGRDFGRQWRIANNERTGISLFTYTKAMGERGSNLYDDSWEPPFENGDEPPLPWNTTLTRSEVIRECTRDPDMYDCRYDYLVTADINVARHTKEVKNDFLLLKQDGVKQELSCGGLMTPKYGVKEWDKMTVGGKVRFSCMKGYWFFGAEYRECLESGRWSYGDWAYCWAYWRYIAWVTAICFGCVCILLLPIVTIYLIVHRRKRREKRALRDSAAQRNDALKYQAPSPPAAGSIPRTLDDNNRVVTNRDTSPLLTSSAAAKPERNGTGEQLRRRDVAPPPVRPLTGTGTRSSGRETLA